VGVALPLGTVFAGAGAASGAPSSGTPNVCTSTHHSSTGRGANTAQGLYFNSCSPEHASMNGNGMGLAVGKPDAGTVGNADDKNPPGQSDVMPGGADGNNGYECDRNSGIANENPAHTGCGDPEDPPPPPPCDEENPSG
jgi:hypothetical protein